MRNHVMSKLDRFNNLSDQDLANVTGGVAPWVIAGLVYLGYQTFEHTDQIAQGFKKGFREGRG